MYKKFLFIVVALICVSMQAGDKRLIVNATGQDLFMTLGSAGRNLNVAIPKGVSNFWVCGANWLQESWLRRTLDGTTTVNDYGYGIQPITQEAAVGPTLIACYVKDPSATGGVRLKPIPYSGYTSCGDIRPEQWAHNNGPTLADFRDVTPVCP